MFIERIKENFQINEPIFTQEILDLFSDYSRAQVFRFINTAKDRGEIVQFDKGIYYLPKMTYFGMSNISVDSVIEKKYLSNKNDNYGVYSGIRLLNMFSVTTQVPVVIEIVSNNESSKCRQITIKGRRFILRRSRFEINRDNVYEYVILQLFNDFSNETKLNDLAKKKLLEFMEEKGVTVQKILELSLKFPANTIKKLLKSGLLQ